MKNKGVIVSIIFILFVGVLITNSTRRLVLSGTASNVATEVSESDVSAAGMPEMAAAPVPPGSAERAGGNLPGRKSGQEAKTAAAGSTERAATLATDDMQGSMQTEEQDQAAPVALFEEEHAPVGEGAFLAGDASVWAETDNSGSSVVISPLTGSVDSAAKKEATVLGSEEYEKKLQENDAQIKKMKDSGIEPNTDSYKNMADYEYRLWDNELNTIYQDILSRMTAEDADALRGGEREWVKRRDQAAHKAISKYNGGTIESIEYIASLADSTRTRVYELLENYGGYLDSVLIKQSRQAHE